MACLLVNYCLQEYVFLIGRYKDNIVTYDLSISWWMNKIFSDTKIFPLPGTLGILGDTEINGLFPASLPSQTQSRKRNYWPIRGLHTTTSANKVRCWMNGSLRSIHSGILKSVPKFVTFRIIINEIFNDCFWVCQLWCLITVPAVNCCVCVGTCLWLLLMDFLDTWQHRSHFMIAELVPTPHMHSN